MTFNHGVRSPSLLWLIKSVFYLHGKRNVECRNILYTLFFIPFLRKEGKNIMICRDCNVLMQPVMSFSKDKHEKFCRCPKCFSETKHRKLRDDELDFGEVLSREIYKRK